MASIRRTTPYPSSPLCNDGIPRVESPSHKLLYGSNYSPTTTSSSRLKRFLSGIFLFPSSQKNSKKQLKRSITRFSLFFVFGFLLGLTPFGTIDFDTQFTSNSSQPQDFSLDHHHTQTVNRVIRENAVVEGGGDGVDGGGGGIGGVDEGVIGIEGGGAGETGGIRDGGDDGMGSVVIVKKQLIIVTPTYNRALQAYFLHRLGQTLRLVEAPLLWIIVEMNMLSMETAEILRKSGVMYRHLVCAKNSTNVKDRGVHQRNTVLQHIEQHKLDGIVYFADDDNIYSLELFQSLREISRFGTWPVAMLAQSKAKAILEGPVCNGSQVIGWHTNEKSKRLRRFHVDMSGFAFNSTILWDPKKWHRPTSKPVRQLDTVKEGFQETTFIEQVVEDEYQMEGLPEGCSRVMNWHLHLDARNLVYPGGWLLQKNLDAVLPVSEFG
ncbi:hypothetical protein C5167_041308 [Papaver somniferum]|uniref:Glycosyltransferases n=1 Tax=Papaver somniferum TaxID=3469 RepID=A0A4Y7IKW5_PAPSO|nr:probable beta-1,4-xylosyltransferase IRX9H isoform X2 [Papaver somniferum]RZC48372.1 hypothetical protein C5167_041308 [Papaver somniferum]